MERVSSKHLFWLEGIATLLFLIGITVLSLYWPAAVGTGSQAPPLVHAAAPWVFGPVQVMLIYLPPWLAALLIPSLVIGMFVSFPWLARGLGEQLSRVIFSLVGLCLLGLLMWFMIIEYWWH